MSYPIDLEDDDTTTNRGEPLAVTDAARQLARRAYVMVVAHEEDSGWVATVPDLPGVMAVGETLDEMVRVLEGAKEAWIASALRHGQPIPAPRSYRVVLATGDALAAD